MDKQIALEVMALMKRSKEHIYSEMYREFDLQNRVLDYSEIIKEFEKLFKRLSDAINDNADIFNTQESDKEAILQRAKIYTDEVDMPAIKMAKLYAGLHALSSRSDITEALMKVVKKVLMEYLVFRDRLESLILGNGKEELVFQPDIEREAEVLLKTMDDMNMPRKRGILLPLLAAFGLGYLLGSE